MADSGKFSGSRILLLDREPKVKNDRTWCFWEDKPGYFEEIVHRRWSRLQFKNYNFKIDLDIAPYEYKMIRGIDFYRYCFGKMAALQITTQYGEIQTQGSNIFFNGDKLETSGALIFNSVCQLETTRGSINLLQHFKGWVIQTTEDVFDASKATLMDFSVSQQHGTTFVYTLPLSSDTALVEYTLFTEKLLPPEEYVASLKEYISNTLLITGYAIKEEEFGVIPMTNKKFEFNKDGMYHIGTAGGQTKASTGYTFRFIQKQSDEILRQLLQNNRQLHSSTAARFRFYDNTFLKILQRRVPAGNQVFETLFRKNKASQVFKFLDNETTVGEELKIISTLPTWPFLKAGLSQLMG
jgi:lycopene beta-cyclase